MNTKLIRLKDKRAIRGMEKHLNQKNNYLQHRINFIAGFLPTYESPRSLSLSVIIY
jgi:hypothetical protein